MSKLNLGASLAKAKRLLKSGATNNAVEVYEAILEVYPKNLSALTALRELKRKKNNTRDESRKREFLNQLITLQNSGEFSKVVEKAKNFLREQPTSPVVWNILGAAEFCNKNYEDAISAFEKALKLDNTFMGAYINAGNAYFEMKDFKSAFWAFRKALQLDVSNYEIWSSYGVSAIELKDFTAAISAFESAVKLDRKNPVAHHNLGTALYKSGRLDDALQAYANALTLNPNYLEALNGTAVILKERGQLLDALGCYKAIYKIDPLYTSIEFNIGLCYQLMDHTSKAMEVFDDITKRDKKNADAFNNLGVCLQDTGKYAEAITAYETAIKLQPDNGEFIYNLGQCELLHGNFFSGWPKYESRWVGQTGIGSKIKSNKPEWRGQPGARVLVYSEQGVGDVIMFSSILPELSSISDVVLFSCDKRLVNLFNRSFPDNVICVGSDRPISPDEFDYHVPIGSLPLYFRQSLASFKNGEEQYLYANTNKKNDIRRRIKGSYSKPLCGISWRGGSQKNNSLRRKDIPLEKFSYLLSNLEFTYINLQYGNTIDELALLKNNGGVDVIKYTDIDNFNDLDGLASLVACCDLIITIDNLTTHLAGALGVPTSVLLPFSSNWRWGLTSSDSYWHASLMLFRQAEADSWDQNIQEVIRHQGVYNE